MQNRRVVSRVMPEIYHQAHLHRLTPFFQAMRLALVDAAPPHVEDPRVVVLSPGTHSETAFDQAFVASLLGFPLLEGPDLTVRDGRVWMRGLGKLEQVDVILRRVDSNWMDALELRGGSRLGVTGLLECVRQGTVSVVNNLGSGILENPALMPFLPDLCERLLGAPLRLPSVDTWWCGDPASLDHVVANLESLVIRPISRGHGRSVLGSALSAEQRAALVDRIRAAPHRFVGQEVLQPLLGADQRARPARPAFGGAALLRRPQRWLVHRHARGSGPGDQRSRPQGAAGHRPRRRVGQGRLGGQQRPGRRRPGGGAPTGRRPQPAHARVRLSRHGAARAQRPVLVRTLRRARRGPAAVGARNPQRGHRDRPRRRQQPGSGDAAAGHHPRQHDLPRLHPPRGRDDARAAGDPAGPAPAGHGRALARPAVDGGPRCARPALRGRLDGAGRGRTRLGCPGRQPVRPGSAADRRQRAGAVRPAGPGRHHQREHGPGPRVVHARLGPGPGARAADLLTAPGHLVPAAGHRRPAARRGGADRRRVDRHLPPALPRSGRRRRGDRAARPRPAQPPFGGLPAGSGAGRPASHPQHLAHGSAVAVAGQPGRAGPDRRLSRAGPDRRR